MRRLSRALQLSLVLLVIFTLYAGWVSPLTLVTGLILSLTISLYLIRGHTTLATCYGLFLKPLHILKYLHYFIVQEVREHMKVASIVLGRRACIRPGFVEVPIEVRSYIALSILALTITNTPGTIAAYVDSDRKVILVHWIDIKSENPLEVKKVILGKFESLAMEIFG